MGFFRHPRTTQERRRACDNDEKQYIRGHRLATQLPNAWDDIIPTREKTWKRHRKVKYRPKDM